MSKFTDTYDWVKDQCGARGLRLMEIAIGVAYRFNGVKSHNELSYSFWGDLGVLIQWHCTTNPTDEQEDYLVHTWDWWQNDPTGGRDQECALLENIDDILREHSYNPREQALAQMI
jgi:hypothetical protein